MYGTDDFPAAVGANVMNCVDLRFGPVLVSLWPVCELMDVSGGVLGTF